MSVRFVTVAVAVLLLMGLAGCSGSGQTGAVTGATPADAFTVTFSTAPSAPAVGQVELVVMVQDPSGKAVDDANVQMSADMIGHTMGELSGTMSPQGNGRYAATAGLSMAGEWQIDVTVQAGAQSARRTFLINVTE